MRRSDHAQEDRAGAPGGSVSGYNRWVPVNPPELDLARLAERELRRTHEVADQARDHDLVTPGGRRDPRRVVDGLAEEVVRLAQDLAGVDADPDPDR